MCYILWYITCYLTPNLLPIHPSSLAAVLTLVSKTGEGTGKMTFLSQVFSDCLMLAVLAKGYCFISLLPIFVQKWELWIPINREICVLKFLMQQELQVTILSKDFQFMAAALEHHYLQCVLKWSRMSFVILLVTSAIYSMQISVGPCSQVHSQVGQGSSKAVPDII